MTEVTNTTTEKKYAVVTGANKGIGLEVCRQLASHGIKVVLTARDVKRGTGAVEKLNNYLGLFGNIIFHQLDVADSQSVDSLAEFVKSQFGKLDILVNNAGIIGIMARELDGAKSTFEAYLNKGETTKWSEQMIETYDLTKACFETNYYGTKRTVEALLPLLQLSDSPRIVNVSSMGGKLKNIPNEMVRGILGDVENLTEKKIDELLDEFLKDFKDCSIEAKGWPKFLSAYLVSKAAVNAYTRILAKQYQTFRVNCVCPGYVKTDINYNTGILTVEEGAETLVMAALLPDDGPTGTFIVEKKDSSFVDE